MRGHELAALLANNKEREQHEIYKRVERICNRLCFNF
jgi:hypothetical protein